MAREEGSAYQGYRRRLGGMYPCHGDSSVTRAQVSGRHLPAQRPLPQVCAGDTGCPLLSRWGGGGAVRCAPASHLHPTHPHSRRGPVTRPHQSERVWKPPPEHPWTDRPPFRCGCSAAGAVRLKLAIPSFHREKRLAWRDASTVDRRAMRRRAPRSGYTCSSLSRAFRLRETINSRLFKQF